MEVRTSKVFVETARALRDTKRYVSSCGGTRSGKTYANLQLLFILASQDKVPTITSVVSETIPHLKRGAIRDFQSILGPAFDENAWNKSDLIYTLPSGSVIEFFSADQPGKVHGPARDRLFINEVQNVSYDTARQLFVRTRGKIILDYNPTASFWVNENVETRDNCVRVHSTYLDNVDSTTGESFLTPEQIAEIEANRGDANWWTVYGEGKFGTLEGVIYNFEQVDALPDPSGLREVWGVDFGFTHDPTAIVRILADTGRKIAYIDEVCYQTGMLNADIADTIRDAGCRPGVHVWADAAEPKSIAEIGTASGCNIMACDKGAPVRSDKRKFQIQWMQGWTLRPTKRSLNWIKEARNYTWAKDRDGNMTGYPIDGWDHLLDASRYALFSEFSGRLNEGVYKIASIR
jgi:phage terminase large subunit